MLGWRAQPAASWGRGRVGRRVCSGAARQPAAEQVVPCRRNTDATVIKQLICSGGSGSSSSYGSSGSNGSGSCTGVGGVQIHMGGP